VKKTVVVMLAVAGTVCACASTTKETPEQSKPAVSETYKPTGSHIRERADGRRSPKNSSSAPVQDLDKSPAVTVIQNQPPK
jgi:hypothetical protein